MKLSNLLMIALLAGALGVFGCSDDPPATGNGGSGGEGTAGTGGDGGSGGGGADPCTGDFCDDSAQPNKAACETFIDGCDSLGAGGAGGAPPTPTPEDCERIGGSLCQHEVGTGGTGGTGGGGGTGGTPSGGNCDYGDCLNEPNKSTCETLVGYCEATLGLFPELLEYCIEGTNLDQCGDPQL